jgi:TonB family protein
VEIYVFGVNVRVHEVWLVDRRTGEVVAKRNTCSPGDVGGRTPRGGIDVDWTSALHDDDRSSKILAFDSDDDAAGDSSKSKTPEVSNPPADLAPRLTRVSGGVLAGKAILRPQPPYPENAAGVEGAVVVEVTLDEHGKVTAARAVSGHALLRDAAVNAAAGWTFSPTELGGRKVGVVGTITFNFTRP